MSKTGNQLIQVIKDSEFQNISKEILEAAIDEELPDSFFKGLPLLSIVISTFNTIANIKDRLFTKKLLIFLYQLKSTPEDKITQQIIKIEYENNYKTKVGEKLLYIIDKCEDLDKASLAGTLFKVFIERKISYDEFISATSIIERTPLPDLLYFINENFTQAPLEGVGSEYISYGLMEIIITKPRIGISNSEPDFGDTYIPSDEEILQHKMKIEDFEINAQVNSIGEKIRKYLKENA